MVPKVKIKAHAPEDNMIAMRTPRSAVSIDASRKYTEEKAEAMLRSAAICKTASQQAKAQS